MNLKRHTWNLTAFGAESAFGGNFQRNQRLEIGNCVSLFFYSGDLKLVVLLSVNNLFYFYKH